MEISDDQHRALSALAQRRGLRGFSALVQEAVARFLDDMSTDEVDFLLGLEGILDENEAREMRSRVEAARATWRDS